MHDRDAYPEEASLPTMPAPPAPLQTAKSLAPDKPAAGKPAKPGTAVAAAQQPPPKQDVQLQAEQQPPQPASQTATAAEYVCGVAKCNLAGLAKGYRRVECVTALGPHTTVRGAAGLDWRMRPGRYMEVGPGHNVHACEHGLLCAEHAHVCSVWKACRWTWAMCAMQLAYPRHVDVCTARMQSAQHMHMQHRDAVSCTCNLLAPCHVKVNAPSRVGPPLGSWTDITECPCI